MQIESPAALVAVVVAARRTRDRDLERAARSELEKRFGVKLTFASANPPESRGGNDAK